MYKGKCQYCGNEFEVKKLSKLKNKKFCSMSCVYKGRNKGIYTPLSPEKEIERIRKQKKTCEEKRKIIEKICKSCGKSFTGYGSHFKNQKFCSSQCVIENNKLLFSGSGNPAFGKTYRTKESHPEWAKKVSDTHKERGTLIGDKNPMKNKDAVARMSKTRRERVTSDPVYRAARSKCTREAWARGAYDGVRVGQCEWHDFVKRDGELVKCQGLWELEYAKYLDSHNINFMMHSGYFSYTDDLGVKRTYHPDFKLDDEQYIDVKNPYYEKLHARKIELVKQQNPSVKIEILGAKQLRALGLILSGYSDGRKDKCPKHLS